jgi:hypothetical protein
MSAPHTSVQREIEARVKSHAEAVAVHVVQKCAEWLRAQGEPELADRLLADKIEGAGA